jgi:UDP-glucose 4-epimerase
MTRTGRKVLVTGASGFLGSHLTRRLLEQRVEVHAVSRRQRTTDSTSPRWWQADTADVAVARDLIGTVRPDLIYHFAGLSTAVPDLELVLPTLNSLLVSTVNILTAATETSRCRVVLAASLTEPQAGDAHPMPGSPYAAAKWASGGYARMFHQLYQLPVVMVRPFMTYGPGQDHRKIIPYLVLSLLRGEAPKLSSGYQQFDWIYIDDVVRGLLAAGDAPSVEGCTIDLGSGTLASVRTVAQKLTELMQPRSKPIFGALPDRPLERTRVADIAYAYAKLDWQPEISLDTGLTRTVAWYREHA